MKMKVVTDGVKNIINIDELDKISGRQIVCHNNSRNWVWLLISHNGIYKWINIEDSAVYPSVYDTIKEAIKVDNSESDIEHYVFDTRVEFGTWLASIGEVNI